MTKIDQSKLRKEIEAQDRRDSRKKGYNIHALRLMLDAAKDVKDEDSFVDAFTPTRGNHRIARNLGLNLDVQRGRWVKKEVSESSSMAKQEVKGQDLIQLLVNALEEGKAAKATELVNQLLRQKVSESLSEKRKVLAERMFTGEGVEELVKTSNEPENREDPPKVAGETGDALSNSDLAVSPADAQADVESEE